MKYFLLGGALATIVAACGATEYNDLPRDAGADGAVQPATHRLAFLDVSEPVRLEPRAVLPLRLSLVDATGAPVAGEEIRLALVANPGDASLGATRLRTDASGHAETTLRASSSATTFRVRATSARAPEGYLGVSVSDRGFGGIDAQLRYRGVRAPTAFHVFLYQGRACPVGDDVDPVGATALPSGSWDVSFSGLGAGQRFAVRADGRGVGGEVVARACVDGLEVVRDEVITHSLPFQDEPLRLTGAYRLELALDLGALPAAAAREWTEAVRLEAGARGDADYILRAVGAAVRARADEAAYNEFVREVDARLRAELTLDLERRDASPVAALARLARDAAAVAQGVDAHASVLASPSEAGNAALRFQSHTLSVDPLTPDVAVDDLQLALAPTATGDAVGRGGDRFAVTIVNFALPFASVARRSADALLARTGVGSAGEWARLTTRCREVYRVVEGTTAACDQACVVDACGAAVERLGAAFDRAIATFGAAHVTVELRYEASARAPTGTLRVGSVEAASVSGHFANDPAASVTGVARLVGSP